MSMSNTYDYGSLFMRKHNAQISCYEVKVFWLIICSANRARSPPSVAVSTRVPYNTHIARVVWSDHKNLNL